MKRVFEAMSVERPRKNTRRLSYLQVAGPGNARLARTLDRLVRVACALSDMPAAAICILDEKGVRVVAAAGLSENVKRPDVSQDARADAQAMIAHLMTSDTPRAIPDLIESGELGHAPLIMGEDAFRAYAGAALEPDPGQPIGALCLLDRVPRTLSEEALNHLEALAGAVSMMLAAGRDKQTLRLQSDRLDAQARKLRHAEERDALTDLMTPVAFRTRVQAALMGCTEDEGAVAVLNLDNFKQVNDGLGHPFGDVYLRAIASSLSDAVGEAGFVARMGGDEFAVFLLGGHADVLARCKALLRETAERSRALGHPELGGLSIGLHTRKAEPGSDYNALYRKADIALSAAKRAGRGQLRQFSADMQPVMSRITQRSRFAAALKAGKILPYFQPQVCLAKRRIVGFEALARWVDARGVVQNPVDFQAMLNDRSVGPELTRQILLRAIEVQRRWRAAGAPPVALGINLSIHDLSRDGLIREAEGWIARAGLRWSDFIFEITEMVVMGERDREVHAALERISSLGAAVALDDFGTGFAGLAHLRNWPVDIVKLDKSFVDGLLDQSRDAAIVASMLSLAKTLCIRTVAEGIETEAQCARLQEMGCDKGQGYVFSPALSEDEALDLLLRTKGQLG
jgi:diguanylate cyclase (GGDEF)-like protein